MKDNKKLNLETLASACIFLFSLFFSLILAEIILSLASPMSMSVVSRDILGRNYSPQNLPKYEQVEVCTDECHRYKDFIPNQVGSAYRRKSYQFDWRINSLRLRGSEILSHSKNQKDILILGDSQTFGLGVEETETFVDKLENEMRSLGKNVRTYNGGVPSYSTKDVLQKLIRVGREIEPKLVIVAVYIMDALVEGDEGNDLWFDYEFATKNDKVEKTLEEKKTKKPKVAFLTKHSHLYNHLSGLYRRIRGIKTYKQKNKELLHHNERDLDIAWNAVRNNLLEVAAYADKKFNAETVVLYIPTISSIQLNDNETLRRLNSIGLPVISPFDKLREGIEEEGIDAFIVPNDGHWNNVAHEHIADVLSEYLIKRNLL